jgi:hypothetical protein
VISPQFATQATKILQTYINEDPNDIGNAFLCALYTELTGKPAIYMTDHLATIQGRYRTPRMKAILGSTIELLKTDVEVESAHSLIELLYAVRGPELSAAEFINELMINELVT